MLTQLPSCLSQGNRLSQEGEGEVVQRATVPLSDVASQAHDKLDLTLRTTAALQYNANKGAVAMSRMRKAQTLRSDRSQAGSSGDTTDGGASSAAERGEAGTGRAVRFAHSSSLPGAVGASSAATAGAAAPKSAWKWVGQRDGGRGKSSGAESAGEASV